MCEIELELKQKATIKHICKAEAWLATGIRKSICYEALPFFHDFRGMTVSDFYLCLEATVRILAIVIMHLISLMINQVVNLECRGVSLTIVFSGK